MVEKQSNQPPTSRRNQQSKLWFLVDYQRFMIFATGSIRLSTGGLFPDAARYELSKVISAHDKHHWLSMSYKGDLSQLWQNRAFCDKFCDKTVAQNCIRCDKVINISGWKKKTALLQSSEMCHDKVIFSSLKTRLFYLETFQFHLLFPALISQHFAIYFYHFG